MKRLSIFTLITAGLMTGAYAQDRQPIPIPGDAGEPPAVEKPEEEKIDILEDILPEGPSAKGAEAAAAVATLQKKLEGVHKMIGEGVVDGRAQTPQEEVLKQLEKWIEDSKPRSSTSEEESESPPGAGAGSGPGSGNQPGSGEQAEDKESPTGAKDSKFRKGSNKVGEMREFLKEKATSGWGRLPEKERESMIQEMKEKLPKGNSSWVEGFSKRLANGEAK